MTRYASWAVLLGAVIFGSAIQARQCGELYTGNDSSLPLEGFLSGTDLKPNTRVYLEGHGFVTVGFFSPRTLRLTAENMTTVYPLTPQTRIATPHTPAYFELVGADANRIFPLEHLRSLYIGHYAFERLGNSSGFHENRKMQIRGLIEEVFGFDNPLDFRRAVMDISEKGQAPWGAGQVEEFVRRVIMLTGEDPVVASDLISHDGSRYNLPYATRSLSRTERALRMAVSRRHELATYIRGIAVGDMVEMGRVGPFDFVLGEFFGRRLRTPEDTFSREIELLKHEPSQEKADALVERFTPDLAELVPWAEIDLIVWVPSTRSTRSGPSFLAEALSERFGPPSRNVFRGNRDGEQQKNQSRPQDRLSNAAENIRITGQRENRNAIAGGRILVVDDIFDSGFSIARARQVLYSNGAEEVYSLTLGRHIREN